jgi:dienelactone hydrolase
MELNPTCKKAYWNDRRMSEEVIASLNEVIETINNGQKFSLVGWSGGGGVAVLIAARNKNVKDILTMAANLDTTNFTKHHKVAPMVGSLNPIDYVDRVRNIPQLHLSGGKDNIIPPFIADGFVKKADSICVHQEILTEVEHSKGWERRWPYISGLPLMCYKY